jgi:hypothetical protein
LTQSKIQNLKSKIPLVLAATHHDPDGRLYAQTTRMLPLLGSMFKAIAIQATHATQERAITLLGSAGVRVRQETTGNFIGLDGLGRARRATVELALQLSAPTILFCDFDRALHWAEYYPDELAQVAARLAEHDFTVLGRTERAFATHPRIQRDTESLVNHVYASVSGHAWDVTAAARGLSRRAAAAILAGCPDESIGTDVSWPLFIECIGGLALGYIATEGLEFETADRYVGEIAAAGGLERWVARLDADPRRWIERLEIARLEIAAALPYMDGRKANGT